jgi:DUF971 family protein
MATPKEIRKRPGGAGMKIVWDDSQVNEWTAYQLREMCHCAACRHELTGENLIPAGSIPKDIHILKAELVGNYALSFMFSDGHSVGIYPFETLRSHPA